MRPELFTIPGTHIAVPGFGAMVMIGFLGALWWMSRRAVKAKQDPDLVLNFGFIALIFMAIGARAFYVIHYWDTQFKHNPGLIFSVRSGGFEYYGGLIGALIPCTLYALYKRLSLRLWLDITAPSLLFGMGIGRIGCFLAGCCYGTPCSPSLPWAVQFPFGSEAQHSHWEKRLTALPADVIYVSPEGSPTLLAPQAVQAIHGAQDQLKSRMDAARAKGDTADMARFEHVQSRLADVSEHLKAAGLDQARLQSLKSNPAFVSPHLHPAQLYSAVGPLLLAWLTNAYFYRRKRHGTVFAIGLMLYSIERFIEETLRSDNPLDTFGLTVSQAVSIGIFVLLGIWLLVLQRMPLRSARAVPYVPRDAAKQEGPQPAAT